MLWNCCVEERSKFLEILYGEKGTFSFIYGANSWLKWVNAEWDTFFFLDSGGNILYQAEPTKTFVDRK